MLRIESLINNDKHWESNLIQLGFVRLEGLTKAIQWETNSLPSTSLEPRLAKGVDKLISIVLVFEREHCCIVLEGEIGI
jgi:hypothetical protein